MAGRRWLTTLGAVGLVLALATPALAQGNSGGKKGGGGGKKNETVYARQVSIDDNVPANSQLKSDGMERDADGVLNLTSPTPVLYTDHRIVHVDQNMMIIGPYPDKCVGVGLNDAQFDFDRGADPLQRGCNAEFPDDGRTLTIEFKPADRLDANDPARLACERFKFLIETSPGPTWGKGYPDEWQTGFAWNDPNYSPPDLPADPGVPADPGLGCKVTPSAAGIITEPGSSQVTANVQFYADPFATVKTKVKGKTTEVEPTTIRLNINFRIDRQYEGEPNAWQIKSQDSDLPISKDLTNDDVRTISADEQLFDLCLAGAGNGCVAIGFKLPLQIRYERFEVAQ